MSRVIISIYDDLHNPHYGGGGAVVVREVARRLAREHRVTVVTGSYRGSRRHHTDHVEYVYLPVGWAGPRAGQLLFHAMLPLLAIALRYDVWVESFTPPYSTSFLPLFTRHPVIGWAHMLSGEDMSRRYRLPFRWVEQRGLSLYDRFIVLNELDRQLVSGRSSGARIAVIPNGVHLPEPTPTDADPGEFILFLGRIDVRQKGLDLLLDAYAAAAPPLPLLIAGAGTPAQEQALRARLPGGDRVQVLGHVSGAAKADLLRRCAFLVLPSRYETFPLTALEAMAYGKPLVCFDLPQLAWISSDVAIRVPPFDVALLAAALRRLCLDVEHRARLAAQARAVAEAHDWEQIAARYRTFVAEVLSE